MLIDFPDKEMISQELRLLMRSRHIYILFSGFLHILLGCYFRPQSETWRKYLQFLGSILLFGGSMLLIASFFYETYSIGHFSDMSRYGLFATLGGMIMQFGGAILARD